MNDDLNILAEKYGLDKTITTGCHNYIPGYIKLFHKNRLNVKNLLEIGIGSLENNQMGGVNSFLTDHGYKSGNSLKCWEEYFPNSKIYGIDIYDHPELTEDRVQFFVADQTSEKDLQSVIDKINAPLDIIIDDGSHQGAHQAFSFMFLHKFLAQGGIYVIEDIQPRFIKRFQNLAMFPPVFRKYIRKNFIVEYFDTRNTCNRHRADDFMVSFTKK